MAFTRTPETQTYSSEQITLIDDFTLQAGYTEMTDKCSGMVNVIPFQEPDGLIGETRYGIASKSILLTNDNAVCRGLHVWQIASGNVVILVALDDGTTSKVYVSPNGEPGTWVSLVTLTTHATTPVRFAEFIDGSNQKRLVMVDGIEGYVFTDGSTVTQITDTDFPTPHVPFPVFLNGRLYLAKDQTGDIYNSDLNAPLNWTAGSFISSEVYPDDIQALVKVNNYILAIGRNGSEFFYDAANSTGSPLARQEGMLLPFGTLYPNSIAANQNTICMVASSGDGENSIKIIEGSNYTDIPAKSVLSLIQYYTQFDLNGCTSANLRSYFLRQKGGLHYVLQFNGAVVAGTDTLANLCPTFIYSFKTKLWSELQANYTNDPTTGYVFPISFAVSGRLGYWFTYVVGQAKGSVFLGEMNSSYASDSFYIGGTLTTTQIGQTLRTTLQDFGTQNRKFLSRVAVNYVDANVSTVDTTMLPYVSYTVNSDYSGGWTTGRQVVKASGDEVGFPMVTQLGNFRRRGFKVYCKGGNRVWKSLELDINKGQQ